MKTIKFKTNINCGGCVSAVTPILNNLVGEDNWSVDTASEAKILTVQSSNISENLIIENIEGAGYTIDLCK